LNKQRFLVESENVSESEVSAAEEAFMKSEEGRREIHKHSYFTTQ
jgi:hypothetical protein